MSSNDRQTRTSDPQSPDLFNAARDSADISDPSIQRLLVNDDSEDDAKTPTARDVGFHQFPETHTRPYTPVDQGSTASTTTSPERSPGTRQGFINSTLDRLVRPPSATGAQTDARTTTPVGNPHLGNQSRWSPDSSLPSTSPLSIMTASSGDLSPEEIARNRRIAARALEGDDGQTSRWSNSTVSSNASASGSQRRGFPEP